MLNKKEIANAASHFQDAAKQYVQGASGRYRAPETRKPDPQSFVSLQEKFRESLSLGLFVEKDVLAVSKKLDAIGYHLFHSVDEGNNAMVFESNDLAFRIATHPMNEDGRLSYTMRMTIRAECPLTLQASDFYQTQKWVRTEILPYVVMVQGPPPIFEQITEYVLRGTHFKLTDYKDVGVLPDGTPVYVDTDPIDFVGTKDDIEADIAKIAENTRNLDLPEPFSWVLPDGRFKQDQFFAPRGVGTLIPAL